MSQPPLLTVTPRSKPSVTLQLHYCSLADVSTLRNLFLASFTEIVSTTVFPPDREIVVQWWDQAFTDELQDSGARFLKVVAVENDTETVISFAKWNLPNDAKTLGEADEQLPPWPALGGEEEAFAKRVGDAFFGGLARGHVRTVNEELGLGLGKGHWYLEMLGTLPEWRGLGAAAILIEWGLNQADEQKRMTYLESSPGAVKLYGKFGFEERSRVEVSIDHVQYHNVCMVRHGLRT